MKRYDVYLNTLTTDSRVMSFLRSVGAQVLRQAQHKLSKAPSPICDCLYENKPK